MAEAILLHPAESVPVEQVISAASEVFGRAMVHGVLSAWSVDTPWGYIAAYRELFPNMTSRYQVG